MTTPSLKQQLQEVHDAIHVLEKRKRDIYKASLLAPDNEKIAPDVLIEGLEEEEPRKTQYPLPVQALHLQDTPVVQPQPCWVAVRPCDNPENKTYLGFLIGRVSTRFSAYFDRANGILHVGPDGHNPCMWVPSLNKIVYGYESWWHELKSPDDLKQISDQDIDSTWYVQVLKSFSKTEPSG